MAVREPSSHAAQPPAPALVDQEDAPTVELDNVRGTQTVRYMGRADQRFHDHGIVIDDQVVGESRTAIPNPRNATGAIVPTNETLSERSARRPNTTAAIMHAMPMSPLCLTRIPLSIALRAGVSPSELQPVQDRLERLCDLRRVLLRARHLDPQVDFRDEHVHGMR